MVTDPIADFINRLRNAGATRKSEVVVPYSKMKHAIADVLVKEGYVKSVEKTGKSSSDMALKVSLNYTESGAPRIHDVKRLSKPSRRMYAGAREIRPVRNGIGTLVLSTPKGILTDKEARENSIGGELLFTIW